MNCERKRECRERIAREGWNRIGTVEEPPDPRYWHGEEELELMYEDMDGRPCTCRAVYSYAADSFRATTGPAKGNRMSCTIAWRPIPEPEAEAAAGAGDDDGSIPFC